eukprot:g70969.t1
MTQTQLSVCLVDEYANQAVSADVAARVEQQVDADASAREIQLIPSRRCHLNAGAIRSNPSETRDWQSLWSMAELRSDDHELEEQTKGVKPREYK